MKIRKWMLKISRNGWQSTHMEDAKTKAAGKGKHIFSHVEWHMEGVRISLKTPIQSENYIWVLKRTRKYVCTLPAFEISCKIL